MVKRSKLAVLTKLLRFEGTQRVSVNQVTAGDIICVAGLTKASVSDTIGTPNITQPCHLHLLIRRQCL